MAVLDDLKTYLGPGAARHSDGVLASVIEVETAAQRRKCRIADEDVPGDYPADLYEALLRRCARNLALRGLTLGLTDVAGTEDGTRSFVPSRDPEITRLESTYRRWTVG